MIEFLSGLTLFGAVWGFWVMITILILICLNAEREEDGFFAFFVAAACWFLFSFWGNKDITTLFSWWHLLQYLGCGLGYAVIRTFFKGTVDGVNKYPSDLEDNVLRWILNWPISFLFWVLSKFIPEAYSIFWNLTQRFFVFVQNLGARAGGKIEK